MRYIILAVLICSSAYGESGLVESQEVTGFEIESLARELLNKEKSDLSEKKDAPEEISTKKENDLFADSPDGVALAHRKARVSLDVFYSFADTVKAKELGTSFIGKTEGAIGIGTSVLLMYDQNFGIDLGLSFDFFRDFLTLENDSTINTFSDPKPSGAILLPRVSVLYKVRTGMVFFFGVNHSIISFNHLVVKADGGIGYQAGMLVSINKTLLLEFTYRSVAVSLSGSGITFDSHLNGISVGLRFQLKPRRWSAQLDLDE